MDDSISFPQLSLPPVATDIIIGNDGVRRIFDPLRLKYVALTPEEWVRRHFTAYMISVKGYPQRLMANEIGLKLNNTRRRCDTVVFDRIGGSPLMIVEYKAPSVEITRAVFDQIARYNIVLKTEWLVVSNGLRHYCCTFDHTTCTWRFVPELPAYSSIARNNNGTTPS